MKNGANTDESVARQVSANARILRYQRLVAAHLPAAEISERGFQRNQNVNDALAVNNNLTEAGALAKASKANDDSQ